MDSKTHRCTGAALAVWLFAFAPGCAPFSDEAAGVGPEIGLGVGVSNEAGRLELMRVKNDERLAASRRLADRYRGRNGPDVHPPRSSPRSSSRRSTPDQFVRRPAQTESGARPRPAPVSGGAETAAHFAGAPLRVAAAALAAATGANVIVADEIADEPVNFRASHVPWRDLLSALARTHDWAVREEAGFIRIHERREDRGKSAASADLDERRVDLLRFLHVAPDDVKKAIAPLFAGAAGKPVMSVDRRTGALMVEGAAADVDLVGSLAEKLDRPAQQVLIETFIVEAGRDLERALGARLGLDRFDSRGIVRVGGVVGRSGSEAGAEVGAAGRFAVDLPAAAPAGGVGFLLDGDRLRVELTALERQGKTRIVSNPRVFTLNGREAVIFQGDEVPYSSVSENGTQTEFKEAGVRLAVTPMIVGGGNLIIEVTVNKDTVDTRVSNPPITRRQIKTSLLVADGAMVVIGGIYFDTRVNAQTRVPVLGRMPLIGRLFRRSQDTRDFRELLVFIAPKIVGAST